MNRAEYDHRMRAAQDLYTDARRYQLHANGLEVIARDLRAATNTTAPEMVDMLDALTAGATALRRIASSTMHVALRVDPTPEATHQPRTDTVHIDPPVEG